MKHKKPPPNISSWAVAKFTMLFSLVALLTGCGHLSKVLDPQGSKVIVHEHKPEGCRSLGLIVGDLSPKQEYLINYFRNEAAKNGGNGIRVKEMIEVSHGKYPYYNGKAYAYKCPEGSTADNLAALF